MQIDGDEIRTGLSRTWPFLLSHHHPHEWYRCYAPTVFGRRIRLCARCVGIYPGIVVALAAPLFVSTLSLSPVAALIVVCLFPLPALVDWTLTTATDRRGYNAVRTITGFALGYGYGVGLRRLVLAFDSRVVVAGISYAVLAGALLYFFQISDELEE